MTLCAPLTRQLVGIRENPKVGVQLDQSLMFHSSRIPMKMSQYPTAIVQAAQVVNELDSQIAAVNQHIARLEGKADRVAAFEQGLKNDNQRRGRRFELLCVDQEYQTAQNTLMRLVSEKASAIAHLEYLRNQFSVAKLEARMAIAQQLVGTEFRDLVGV